MSRRGDAVALRLASALAALAVAGAANLPAQAVNPIVSASLEGDSIRVGGVFRLVLHVDLPEPGTVRFPAVLPLPEELEQRDAVDIDSGGGTAWRATYPLSAWSADSLTIPPVEATIVPENGEEFPVTILAPPVRVSSILPSDEADLALREARPYLRVRGFPWWALLGAAALLAAAWWWWRRRDPAPRAAPTGPAHATLREFDRLRGEWTAGTLTAGQFYDRYEAALRRYLRMTRRWAPNRGLLGLSAGAELLGALRASLFVRFAHLRAREGGPESALEAGEEFVRSELAAEVSEGEERAAPDVAQDRPEVMA